MATKGFQDVGTGRVSHYDPSLSTTYATGSLWRTAPMLEFLHDPAMGVLCDECFQDYDPEATNGNYVFTQATAGTGAISTVDSGAFILDCNSTTQGQGVQIQRVKSPFVPAANKNLWFECKVKVTDTFDKCQFFAGLAEADTSIIGSGAISTANHIGWLMAASAAGTATLAGEKASAAGSGATTVIPEDTYVRLGFYVEGVTSVTGYVDGVAQSTTLATANIPIVALYPSFVCQTDGTNDPIVTIQGYRVFQLR